MAVKYQNNGYLNYYRSYLYDIVSHLFTWSGDLPDRCGSAWIENILIENGTATAINYNGELRILRGALSGLDWLGLPVRFSSANPKMPLTVRDLPGQAVICYNNGDPYNQHGSVDIIDIYAHRLANIAISIDSSLYNSRVAAIFNADGETEARQIVASYKQVIEGHPLVVNVGNQELFTGKQRIYPLRAKDNLITPELTDAFNDTMAEFFRVFGVETLAVDKRERVITAEAESGAEQNAIAKTVYLAAREEFCREVKRVLGFDLSVKMNIGGRNDERGAVKMEHGNTGELQRNGGFDSADN